MKIILWIIGYASFIWAVQEFWPWFTHGLEAYRPSEARSCTWASCDSTSFEIFWDIATFLFWSVVYLSAAIWTGYITQWIWRPMFQAIDELLNGKKGEAENEDRN